jgi:hypothetical protein
MANLVGELEDMGMKVHLDPQKGTVIKAMSTPKDSEVAETPKGRSNQRDGTRKYWDEVTKIKEAEKCTVWEARQRYGERNPKESVNVVENPDAFRQKMSVLKKAYWQKVSALAAEKGISKHDARKILRDRGAEEPATVEVIAAPPD